MTTVIPEIEITDFITLLPNGGWKGSAKINGKIYTGEFAMVENYEVDGQQVQIRWEQHI